MSDATSASAGAGAQERHYEKKFNGERGKEEREKEGGREREKDGECYRERGLSGRRERRRVQTKEESRTKMEGARVLPPRHRPFLSESVVMGKAHFRPALALRIFDSVMTFPLLRVSYHVRTHTHVGPALCVRVFLGLR